MTGLDLDAIRQRVAAASPGPWTPGDPPITASPADVAFACAARADVPALLNLIDELRAEVFTLTNSEDAMLTIVGAERDTALAEVQRLRSQLAAAAQCEALDCPIRERGR